MGLKQEKEV